MSGHGISFDEDPGGWVITRCECGWFSPGCPDEETAADVWGGHIVEAVSEEMGSRVIELEAERDALRAENEHLEGIISDLGPASARGAVFGGSS